MPKPEYYPIDRDAASMYDPVFTGEHWHHSPSQPLIDKAKDETMSSAVTVGSLYDYGVKIQKLAEIGEQGSVLAEYQSVGSLLKSTYEAIQIKRRKNCELDLSSGEYTAAQLPLGFSVRFSSQGYEATYVQRTVGHIVMVDKVGSKVFRRVLPKMDFIDGSLVDKEVIDSNPFESYRTMTHPSLFMGPSRMSGWRLGTVFEGVSKTGQTTIEQKLRIARTEVFTPQKQGNLRRGKKLREPKKAELRLHT